MSPHDARSGPLKIAIAGDTASAIVHRVGNSDDFAAVVRGVIEPDKADH